MSERRKISAPKGSKISCKGWQQEAAFRMIQNNLDPNVAENNNELIVYGGLGKAARNWDCYYSILDCLKRLENDRTERGKPIGQEDKIRDTPLETDFPKASLGIKRTDFNLTPPKTELTEGMSKNPNPKGNQGLNPKKVQESMEVYPRKSLESIFKKLRPEERQDMDGLETEDENMRVEIYKYKRE